MERIGAQLVVDGMTSQGPAVVEVEDGLIVAVRPATGPVTAQLLVPGFIDLQVNGIDDIDVATADGADWDRLDTLLLAQGVTSWCPTLVTSMLDRYGPALERITEAAARSGPRPAIVGAHLEGPFLGGKLGAHRPELVIPPDLDWIRSLPPIVKVMTLGAEVDGAAAAIRLLVERGILVSIGHSAADLATATAAIDAGARMVTHGYNAMSGLDHRAPGMVGAFLTDDRVAVSLIADLVHVHPVAIDVAVRCKHHAGVVLVTDSVAWRAGHVGPVAMQVVDGAPRLPDGTLAGSALAMDVAVANVARACGISLPSQAVAARSYPFEQRLRLEAVMDMASHNPAQLLGLEDRGSIQPGLRADLVALDPETMRCRAAWVGGELAYEA